MRLFRLRLAHLAGVIGLVLLSGCATTTVRQHPQFADSTRQVHRIAILPPQVTHTLIQFDGKGPRNPEKEARISQDIVSSLRGGLEQRGYTVVTELVSALDGQDPDLSFQFEELKAGYQESKKELYSSLAMDEDAAQQFQLSVGPVANTFALLGQADALLLVRFDGIEKSSGQVAKEVVASALLSVLTGVVMVPAPETGSAELALIDGITGDILWTNVGGSAGVGGVIALHVLAALPELPQVAGTAPTTDPQQEAPAVAPTDEPTVAALDAVPAEATAPVSTESPATAEATPAQ